MGSETRVSAAAEAMGEGGGGPRTLDSRPGGREQLEGLAWRNRWGGGGVRWGDEEQRKAEDETNRDGEGRVSPLPAYLAVTPGC